MVEPQEMTEDPQAMKRSADTEENSNELSPFNRPFPGQGIADSNDSYPHNRPPEFTNYDKAQEFLFDQLTEKGESVVSALHEGATVEDLTEMVLNTGYIDGKWDQNLLMLLAEPTVYIILFIAEVAGVDYILYDEEEGMTSADGQMQAENHLAKALSSTTEKVEKDIEEKGADDSISAALPASLLERGKPNGSI